jgi:hypothetical protein
VGLVGEKRKKGQPHDPPTIVDKLLDKAAKRPFPPDSQGRAVDEELRRITEDGAR